MQIPLWECTVLQIKDRLIHQSGPRNKTPQFLELFPTANRPKQRAAHRQFLPRRTQCEGQTRHSLPGPGGQGQQRRDKPCGRHSLTIGCDDDGTLPPGCSSGQPGVITREATGPSRPAKQESQSAPQLSGHPCRAAPGAMSCALRQGQREAMDRGGRQVAGQLWLLAPVMPLTQKISLHKMHKSNSEGLSDPV